MSADNIILPNDFDASKISYGAVKKLDNGGKSIYIKYAGEPLLLQLPEMSAPFGVSKWTGEGKTKFSLDLSFAGKENRKVLQTFFDNMTNLDKKFITDAIENSPTWFNKKYTSFEVVEALYTAMVKFAKDKTTGEVTDKYPATFKMSIPVAKDGSFDCEVFDAKCQPTSLAALEAKGGIKGARVTAIVQCLGIWIAGSKFGCSWKVVQMKVATRQTISGYALREIPDDKGHVASEKEDDASVGDGNDIMEHAVEVGVDDAVPADDDAIVESDDDLDAKPSATTGKKILRKSAK